MENLLQIFLNRPSFSALFFVCTWPSEMCVSGAWKILSAADEAYEKVGIISATVTCSLIMLNNVSITSDKGGRMVDTQIFFRYPYFSQVLYVIGNLLCVGTRESRNSPIQLKSVWKKAPVIIGNIDLWLTCWCWKMSTFYDLFVRRKHTNGWFTVKWEGAIKMLSSIKTQCGWWQEPIEIKSKSFRYINWTGSRDRLSIITEKIQIEIF